MGKASRRNRRPRNAAVVTLDKRDQRSSNKFLGELPDNRTAGERIRDRAELERGKNDRISRMLRGQDVDVDVDASIIEPVDADGVELGDAERQFLAGALARSGVLVVDEVVDFGIEDAIGIKVPGAPVVMSNDDVEIRILADNGGGYDLNPVRPLTKDEVERARKDEKNRKVREARALKRQAEREQA